MKKWLGLFLMAIFLGAVAMNIDHTKKFTPLRVAFPAAKKSLTFEPTNIQVDYEYVFLENIYSPLVEISAGGAVEPGIAEKADWIGDELHLKIRRGLKTQSGIEITAEDALFSLKRLLILSGNTHGNFRDIICPGFDLKSIEQNCPGMWIEKNTLILKPKGPKSFLLPMLTAIDFAIIPRGSVDPKSLAITNMKETTGPYYVSSDDGNGNIDLTLNTSHYHSSPDVSQKIKLVPMVGKDKTESLAALEKNLVDHVMTVDNVGSSEIIKFANTHPEFNLHQTLKIRTLILAFTERGLSELSDQQRRYIAHEVGEAFSEIYGKVPGYQRRIEFFPALGDGSLKESQKDELEKLASDRTSNIGRQIQIGLFKSQDLDSWIKPIQKKLSEADCFKYMEIPDLNKNLDPSKIPHALVAITDTGFAEDISLISYSLNAGYLGLAKKDRQGWLAKYMAIENKDERLKMLRQLHFDALAKPTVVPLIAASYTALVRKPWKMELSELYANDQLWRIKHP